MYEVRIENNGKKDILSELDANSLRRVATGSFTEEVSMIPSAEFTVLPHNPCYDSLHEATTHVVVHNTVGKYDEFEGRIVSITESMSSTGIVTKAVTCEGLLGYLCDSVQPYRVYTDTDVSVFLQQVLEWHNSITTDEKHIYLGSCDIHSMDEKITCYGNTLDEIKRVLVDKLGGEIRIRRIDGRLCLDYLTQYGAPRSTRVELAKNIVDMSVKRDVTSVITRLVPLGATLSKETEERLTIADVNEGKIFIDDESAMATYGVVCGTVEFDDCEDAQSLIERGRSFLANHNRVKKSYRGNVLDLSTIGIDKEPFCAGDTYPFWNTAIGIDEPLRLTKRKVDIYRPYQPYVEIGDKVEKLTDISMNAHRYIKYEAPRQQIETLKAAKDSATALIKAGINGYVVVNENEILIMDTPSKETATKVWRWNSGGFAYSSTGYNGDYGKAAITMNGEIVADFITAGVLRGIEILNGNGKFRVDENGNCHAESIEISNGDGVFRVAPDGSVSAAALDISGGRINIATSNETDSRIQLTCNEWSIALSPLELRLHNSGINRTIVVQAGGVFMYDSGYEKVHISSAGTITAGGDLIANGDVYGAGTSLGAYIARTDLRLDSLEARMITGGL